MLISQLKFHMLLQDMLGEALGELEYVRINQLLGHKALRLLQRKASMAVRKAKDCALSNSSSQVAPASWVSQKLYRS